MGHIFISYSHKDKDYVHKLQEALQNEGFDVWIDDRIDYGTQWPKVIQDQLDACDAFIVVVSENSYESEWVQNEVARAKWKGKPFFPLLLNGDPWLSIQVTQWVDVRDKSLPPKKFYERLAHVAPRKNVNILSTDEKDKLAEALLLDYWEQLGSVLEAYYQNGAPSSELEELEIYVFKIEQVLDIPRPGQQHNVNILSTDEKGKLTEAFLQDYWNQLVDVLVIYYENGSPSSELEKIENHIFKIEQVLGIPGPQHMVGGGSIRKIKHRSASYSLEDAPPAPSSKSEEEKYRSLLAKLEGNYKVAEGMIANEARQHPTLTREELIVVIVKRLERYKK